ncbi:hypothetical protein LSUB1_G003152 [Lachnellula subtilissima]|uniref:Xylanolytic transcriptional activator regulatory domain-containing protein n=1 Tax=Lachnellula subtilissima TaxID=602034 RepID=A0A8H8RQY6_9HELO|nr:hypothetical protein LSUB1_G003152 [Lachnellula subtilissima]
MSIKETEMRRATTQVWLMPTDEVRMQVQRPATDKDKTLVEILERLKSLEGKVDRIPLRAPVHQGFGPPQPSPSSQPSFGNETTESTSYASSINRPPLQHNTLLSDGDRQYKYASAAHKMLTWPAISQLLLQTVPSTVGDLNSLRNEGSAFILRMQTGTPNLPLDETLSVRPFVGMQTQATRVAGGVRTTFPDLTRDTMFQLATAYFDSFNLIYPFMDRQNFLSDTLSKVQTEGFDGDTDSVVALLIFALGDLALEGSQGKSIERHGTRASGVRGGTDKRPPGLALFNEARKRMGFILTDCNLENVQVFSLAALYYECCSRHVENYAFLYSNFCSGILEIDSLSLISLSSHDHLSNYLALLIGNSNTIDWGSSKGDLIKRAYWHCALMETTLHLELDLPLTGILSLEHNVGLPAFKQPFCEADDRANKTSNFESHYSSLLALTRFCANLHVDMNKAISTEGSTDTPSTSRDSPLASSLKQLTSELAQWRGNLPENLQWAEDRPAAFPSPQANIAGYNQAIDPELSLEKHYSQQLLFSTNLDEEPKDYPYLFDIQVALLRTRYYYAKYMAYRPCVYKVLHFPEQVTQDDAEGVAECLRSCLKWPLTMSPVSRRKRLIPYLFSWSQNFLGILLIFHMTRHNRMLQNIRANMCGPTFEADANISIGLMLDWIRDLKSVDPIASWCWKILQGIYPIEE